MATYNKPAVLIRGDGTEFTVNASLRSFQNGLRPDWDGRLAVNLATHQELLGEPGGRIRLQGGSEGDVAFVNMPMFVSPATQITYIDVLGNGDVPF